MSELSIKKTLSDTGMFTKAQVDTIAKAATYIAGDHQKFYDDINDIVAKVEELNTIKQALSIHIGAPAVQAVKEPVARAPRKPRTPKQDPTLEVKGNPGVALKPEPPELPSKQRAAKAAPVIAKIEEEETIDL